MERIIKDRPSKQDKSATVYLIKWKGYGVQYNTWELEEDVDREVILAYIRSTSSTGKLQQKHAYKRAKQ